MSVRFIVVMSVGVARSSAVSTVKTRIAENSVAVAVAAIALRCCRFAADDSLSHGHRFDEALASAGHFSSRGSGAHQEANECFHGVV